MGDSEDLQIYHNGSNSYVAETGTGDLVLQGGTVWIQHSNGENALKATENAGVELRYNSVKKFETTSAGTSVTGTLTTEHTSGNVGYTLHANGNSLGAQIKLHNDHGVAYVGQAGDTTGDLLVWNESNTNVKFATNNAEKFRIENVGTIFSDDAYFGDNYKINLGASSDLQIYHDGTHSRIHNLTGALIHRTPGYYQWYNNDASETLAYFNVNGACDLYYDGTKKFQTTSYGCLIGQTSSSSGVSSPTRLSLGSDYHDAAGTDPKLSIWQASDAADHMGFGVSSNQLDVILTSDSYDFVVYGGASGNTERFRMYGDGTGTKLPDSSKAIFGTGDDLEIYHNGTDSYIANTTGNLYVKSPGDIFLQPKSSEAGVYIRDDSAVELYFDGVKKLETISDGALVTGTLKINDGSATDNRIAIGNSGDLLVYHDGSNTYLHNNTGRLRLEADNLGVGIYEGPGSETLAMFNIGAECSLYYDNTKVFETTSYGAKYTLSNTRTIVYSQTTNNNDRYQEFTYSRSGNSRGDCSRIQLGEGSSSEGRINVVTSAGNQGLSAGAFISNGGTTWGEISDTRLKNKISDITNALSTIDKIDTWKYSWKNDSTNKPHLGVTAQSVEELYPEVLETTKTLADDGDDTDYKGVLYAHLIPVCIAALKEAKVKIETLETEVAALKG